MTAKNKQPSLKRKKLNARIRNLEIKTGSDQDYLGKLDYNWDSLTHVYGTSKDAVNEYRNYLTLAIDTPVIKSHLGLVKDTAQPALMQLAQDLDDYDRGITALFKKHRYYKGPIKSFKELSIFNTLITSYQLQIDEFTTVSGPNLAQIAIDLTYINRIIQKRIDAGEIELTPSDNENLNRIALLNTQLKLKGEENGHTVH